MSQLSDLSNAIHTSSQKRNEEREQEKTEFAQIVKTLSYLQIPDDANMELYAIIQQLSRYITSH